jgi:hypothetical protein
MFACGKVAEDDEDVEDDNITHFVVADKKAVDVKDIREIITGSGRNRFPKVVGLK